MSGSRPSRIASTQRDARRRHSVANSCSLAIRAARRDEDPLAAISEHASTSFAGRGGTPLRQRCFAWLRSGHLRPRHCGDRRALCRAHCVARRSSTGHVVGGFVSHHVRSNGWANALFARVFVWAGRDERCDLRHITGSHQRERCRIAGSQILRRHPSDYSSPRLRRAPNARRWANCAPGSSGGVLSLPRERPPSSCARNATPGDRRKRFRHPLQRTATVVASHRASKDARPSDTGYGEAIQGNEGRPCDSWIAASAFGLLATTASATPSPSSGSGRPCRGSPRSRATSGPDRPEGQDPWSSRQPRRCRCRPSRAWR
jgi:hypothetical protein